MTSLEWVITLLLIKSTTESWLLNHWRSGFMTCSPPYMCSAFTMNRLFSSWFHRNSSWFTWISAKKASMWCGWISSAQGLCIWHYNSRNLKVNMGLEHFDPVLTANVVHIPWMYYQSDQLDWYCTCVWNLMQRWMKGQGNELLESPRPYLVLLVLDFKLGHKSSISGLPLIPHTSLSTWSRVCETG